MSQRKPQADPRHAPRKSPSRRSRQDNHRRPTSRRSDKAQTRSTPAPSKMSRPPTTQNHSNRDAMKINRSPPTKKPTPTNIFPTQAENPRKPRATANAPGSLQWTPHKRSRTPPIRPTRTNTTETKRPQNKSAALHRHPLITAPPGTPRAQPSSGERSAPGTLPDHPRSPDLRCRSRRHRP